MTMILCVDPDRVLDESAAGAAGATELRAAFDEAKATYDKMRQSAKQSPGPAQKALLDELGAYEAASLQKIEARREELRRDLMTKAKQVIEEVRQARGAKYVLDARVVFACPTDDDITAAVIEKLDAG